jgi:crotonobetainyl-CoA:carnitine CoA-transferase CaiB-like acyl-CoA transferase
MKGDRQMALALEGIRVLDMAWLGPGNFCATVLGDLGAEVIKIYEAHPERRGGPVMFLFSSSANFPGWRNLKAMGLDMKTEQGRDIFYNLVKTADVVTEGFRPGVVKRLKIDYNTVKTINPRIVYASLSGYGQDGPYRDLAGHDINYLAIGGLLGATGVPGGPPVIPGTVLADFAAGGMCAVIGILAALMARVKSGKGQFVDVSSTDAIVELTSMQINPYLTDGILSKRGEGMLTGAFPWWNVYETKDGKYISVGAVEPWFWANLCQLLGCEQFIEHQWAGGEKLEEIFKHFRETFRTKTREEWLTILWQKDTCVAPVYTPDELVSDQQLIARNMIVEWNHPTLGRTKQVGSMFKLSDSPISARNWTTRFGQHTDEILLSLGYSRARIRALRKAGVIA